MRKIYQKEWFGIKFSSLDIDLSRESIAGINFYSIFYKEFFRIYHDYSDLPKEWRTLKDEIVNHISKLLSKNSNSKVLSIGCGAGYVENQLCSNDKSLDILAIEPGVDMTQWIDKKVSILHGLFPQVLDNQYKSSDFDLIFASGIDYVFDDESYSKFLKSVVEFGAREFLLTELFVAESGFNYRVKTFIKFLLTSIGLRKIDKSEQLWGFLRTTDEHIVFLKDAGFSEFEIGCYDYGAFWILAKA